MRIYLAGTIVLSRDDVDTGKLLLTTSQAPALSVGDAVAKPCSSNLLLKKEFTEKDRNDFLRLTFEFICRFFEASFERIDSRRMAATLYRGGKKTAECSVRQEGLGRNDGIAFSYDASVSHSSYNELLTVEADQHSLYLKPLGIGWSDGGRDKHLSQEGAAELYWAMFIKNAQ